MFSSRGTARGARGACSLEVVLLDKKLFGYYADITSVKKYRVKRHQRQQHESKEELREATWENLKVESKLFLFL